MASVGASCGYHYDLSEDWRHTVTFERMLNDPSELPPRLKMRQGDNVPEYEEEEED